MAWRAAIVFVVVIIMVLMPIPTHDGDIQLQNLQNTREVQIAECYDLFSKICFHSIISSNSVSVPPFSREYFENSKSECCGQGMSFEISELCKAELKPGNGLEFTPNDLIKYMEECDKFEYPSSSFYLTETFSSTLYKEISTTTEPVTTEPVTTEPVTTEPVTTEPVTTEPVTSEPVTTEPVTTEPVTSEPVTTEPVTTEPVTTEPVTTEPVTTEPVTTEPVTSEPVTSEPVTSEPAPTEPVTTEPAPTEPAPTEPVTSEPAVTEEPELFNADKFDTIIFINENKTTVNTDKTEIPTETSYVAETPVSVKMIKKNVIGSEINTNSCNENIEQFCYDAFVYDTKKFAFPYNYEFTTFYFDNKYWSKFMNNCCDTNSYLLHEICRYNLRYKKDLKTYYFSISISDYNDLKEKCRNFLWITYNIEMDKVLDDILKG